MTLETLSIVLGIVASLVAILQFIAQPPAGLVRLFQTTQRQHEPAVRIAPTAADAPPPPHPLPLASSVKWSGIPERMLAGSASILHFSIWFVIVAVVMDKTSSALLGFACGFIYVIGATAAFFKVMTHLQDELDAFSRLYLIFLLVFNSLFSLWAGGVHRWSGSNDLADMGPLLQIVVTGLAFLATAFESRSWTFGMAWGALLTLSMFLPGELVLDAKYQTSRAIGNVYLVAPIVIVGGLLGWFGKVMAKPQ